MPLPSRVAGALTFRRWQRLAHDRQYQAVYAAKVSRTRGPLVVHGAPNGLTHSRLGLSVGSRVGGAVVRNKAKRIVREAFRLDLGLWPRGFDFVVSVRGGKGVGERGLDLAETRAALVELSERVAADCRRRQRGAHES